MLFHGWFQWCITFLASGPDLVNGKIRRTAFFFANPPPPQFASLLRLATVLPENALHFRVRTPKSVFMRRFPFTLILAAAALPCFAETGPPPTPQVSPPAAPETPNPLPPSLPQTPSLQTQLATMANEAAKTRPELAAAQREWDDSRKQLSKAILEHPQLADLRARRAQAVQACIDHAKSPPERRSTAPDPYVQLKEIQTEMEKMILGIPDLVALRESHAKVRTRYETLRDEAVGCTPEGRGLLKKIEEVKKASAEAARSVPPSKAP